MSSPLALMVASSDEHFREMVRDNLANIPNANNLAPAVLDNWVFKERHGVPFPDAVMTLAYNKEMLSFAPRRLEPCRPALRRRCAPERMFVDRRPRTLFCRTARSQKKRGRELPRPERIGVWLRACQPGSSRLIRPRYQEVQFGGHQFEGRSQARAEHHIHHRPCLLAVKKWDQCKR